MGSCIAAATGLFGAAASAQTSFSPEITFADDGMYVDVRGDDVETVTLTTKDGSTLTYDGSQGRYGYNRSATEPIEGWHGTIEQVEASNGEETKVRQNPHYRLDLEVGCSTYQTAGDVAELRLDFEHATKTYDPPQGGDGREPVEYGSPGHALREVVEMDDETCITRTDGCSPAGSGGVTFDCTSVTVDPDEFVHVEAACYGVELTFADGSTEQVLEQGERVDPPATFEGSGENAGKVIQSIGFSYDEYGDGWFHYENPDAGSCEPVEADAAAEENETSTENESSTESDDLETESVEESDDADEGDLETDSDDGSGDESSDDGDDETATDGETSDESGSDATSDDGSSDETSGDADDGGSDAGSTEDDSAESSDDSDDGGFNWRDLNSAW